jgi:hypothetical protein
MNLESMWQSPSQTRTVKISSTSAAITPAFGHPAITFDTGDPGLLGIPTDDWTLLVNAVGATQDSNSNWWFPCGSTMSLGLKGNQGRTYTFALGDVTNQQNGLCGALANDAGATTNWYFFWTCPAVCFLSLRLFSQDHGCPIPRSILPRFPLPSQRHGSWNEESRCKRCNHIGVHRAILDGRGFVSNSTGICLHK